MMLLSEWACRLHTELSEYCQLSGLEAPTWGWVAAHASKVLHQYPAGISRAVLLTEVEAAWCMSLRRGEHGSQLKQIVTSQQLAGGEAVLGRLLASTKDDFRYRLVVDDTGIDVIIHNQYQDWLGYLKHVGCDFSAESDFITVAFYSCRLMRSSRRQLTLLPSERAVFHLDVARCSRLLANPLLSLHNSFVTTFPSNGIELANNSVCGVYCRVVEVSPTLTYPTAGAGGERKFCTLLLEVAGQIGRAVGYVFDSNAINFESGASSQIYLVLHDDQVVLRESFLPGEIIFLYRPWLAANSEEHGVFGGSVDNSHRAIGHSSTFPEAEHIARRRPRPASSFHFCLGAVSCISLMTQTAPRAFITDSPFLQQRPRASPAGGVWDTWGRVLRLLFVAPSVQHNKANRLVTVFAELLPSGDGVVPLACSLRSQCGSDLNHPRVFVALQCSVNVLPGMARSGGRSLKPGHVALLTGMTTESVQHLQYTITDGASVVNVTLLHASLCDDFCRHTSAGVVSEVEGILARLLWSECTDESLQDSPVTPTSHAFTGGGRLNHLLSPDSVALSDPSKMGKHLFSCEITTVGVKRRLQSTHEPGACRVCCTVYDRQDHTGTPPDALRGTRKGVFNYSSVAAIASSPSLVTPSLSYLSELSRGRRGEFAAYGLLYGSILSWEFANTSVAGTQYAGIRVLFREPSGCCKWLALESDCVVATPAVTVAPSFSVAANDGTQFCIVVSMVPLFRKLKEGGSDPLSKEPCSHRIDVITELNCSGMAWALASIDLPIRALYSNRPWRTY